MRCSVPATSSPSAPSGRSVKPACGSRRTSRSSASTTSPSPPISTHPSPPSGCRPSSSGKPPDERSWNGSRITRSCPGRCFRPSSSCALRRPRRRRADPSDAGHPAGAPNCPDIGPDDRVEDRERRRTMEERNLRWRRATGFLAAIALRGDGLRTGRWERRADDRGERPGSQCRRIGAAGPQRLGRSRHRVHLRERRRRGQRLRDVDRRRAGLVPGDGRAVDRVRRRHDQLHRSARPRYGPHGRHRGRQPARRGRSARTGPDADRGTTRAR